jgi:polyphosphate kinase 2
MGKKQPKLDNELYEAEMTRLQAELVEMQEWVKATGTRLVVLFEGRDAAGKGGAIKRITEYLNPRVAQVVALPAPTERQRTQWYFQRYIEQLPAGGEIRLFDRSWYNRAGVETVMGYCTPEEHVRFLRQVPIFERMLIDDGVLLRKYWFSVSDKEQEKRFKSRMTDPMRRWKLSPTDLESLTRWEEYSRAKDEMFVHTDVDGSRWHVIEAEDKKRARINMITHLLATVPYEHVPLPDIKFPSRPKGTGYRRTARSLQSEVVDYAAKLVKEGHPPKYVDPEDATSDSPEDDASATSPDSPEE